MTRSAVRQTDLQRVIRAARREGAERVTVRTTAGEYLIDLKAGAGDGATPSDVLSELERHFRGKA